MSSIGTRKKIEEGGGIRHTSIAREGVYAGNLHPDVLDGSYFIYRGKGQPLLVLADMSALASGGDGVSHLAILPGGLQLAYNPIGAGTILGPIVGANGLDLTLDQTEAEGANYVVGGLYGPHRYVIATDEPFFIRCRAMIDDVSGCAEFAVGFRKAESVQAAIDNYDEAAYLNVLAGDIKRESILNNAATVTVDSTLNWADGETHELEVRVYGNRVEFLVDGVPRSVGAAYDFDDAEVVVPFLYVLLAAAPTAHVYVTDLRAGKLAQDLRDRTRR